MDGRLTNGLRVGWVTPLAFYENRTLVLRALEDQGVLHRFFVREKDTGAQIGKPHHELRVGARGILAVLFPPESESSEPLLTGIRLAFDQLAPIGLKSVSVFTQHVLSLDQNYDEARRALASSVVCGLGERTHASDSAVLFDGHWSHGGMSVEFGVVDSDEISQRLIGGVGRAHPPRDALSHRILPDDLPGVALYIEANRTVDIPEGLGASEFGTFLLERWREAADDSDEVATLLLDQAPIRGSVRPEGAES